MCKFGGILNFVFLWVILGGTICVCFMWFVFDSDMFVIFWRIKLGFIVVGGCGLIDKFWFGGDNCLRFVLFFEFDIVFDLLFGVLFGKGFSCIVLCSLSNWLVVFNLRFFLIDFLFCWFMLFLDLDFLDMIVIWFIVFLLDGIFCFGFFWFNNIEGWSFLWRLNVFLEVNKVL